MSEHHYMGDRDDGGGWGVTGDKGDTGDTGDKGVTGVGVDMGNGGRRATLEEGQKRKARKAL